MAQAPRYGLICLEEQLAAVPANITVYVVGILGRGAVSLCTFESRTLLQGPV
jgi:hypothetical protein